MPNSFPLLRFLAKHVSVSKLMIAQTVRSFPNRTQKSKPSLKTVQMDWICLDLLVAETDFLKKKSKSGIHGRVKTKTMSTVKKKVVPKGSRGGSAGSRSLGSGGGDVGGLQFLRPGTKHGTIGKRDCTYFYYVCCDCHYFS